MPEAESHALPGPINDSWRAWLMTGVRRNPVDRRRLRGANRGLKRMLLEGMSNGGDRPHAWKDFSGAMIRHAVDDAMRSLPQQDKQVLKLAYFGGYSNREIAEQVGLTETTVQRRLRRALAAISEHVQHGRALGRRAAFAVGVWLSGRWVSDSVHHLAQATAVASVTVVVVAAPAPPSFSAAPAQSHVDAVISRAPVKVIPPIPTATPDAAAQQHAVVKTPPVHRPPVQLPVNVPALPPLPIKVKAPQL